MNLPRPIRVPFPGIRPSAPWGGDVLRDRQRRLLYGGALVVTAGLTLLGSHVMAHSYGVNGTLALLLALAQAAPLLPAVTRPLAAWWIMTAADVAGSLVILQAHQLAGNSWPWPPAVLAGQLVLLIAVARRERRLTLVTVWLVLTVSGFAVAAGSAAHRDSSDTLLSLLGGGVLLVVGALRERHDAQQRVVEQQLINQSERARRTLLEERARIARELHDVVAHHMSVITVQADSAPYRIAGLAPAALQEFAAIAGTARRSLAEMRMLLGVLRGEDAEQERAPQPGLDDVPRLIEATSRIGVPAELCLGDEVVAPGGPLPQAVELSAYRIVQEALANVVRHAPGAHTRVEVGLCPKGSDLTVLVVNDAPPHPSPSLEVAGTGHGLVGMRERVRLVSGTLETGPTSGGGFRVAARLPLLGLPELPDLPSLPDKDTLTP